MNRPLVFPFWLAFMVLKASMVISAWETRLLARSSPSRALDSVSESTTNQLLIE
jgi:hypothetical protein